MAISSPNRFDRVVELLGGLKLSFFLMVLLGLLVAQRALISQKVAAATDDASPAFIRFANLFGLDSPDLLTIPFAVTMALFLVNLFFSCLIMLRRVRSRLGAARSFRDAVAIAALSCQSTFSLPSGGGERMADALRTRGYRVRTSRAGDTVSIAASKREAGTWGVLFFHLTFFVVMIGVAMSLLTRFSGYVELSPGEVFVEKRDNYRRMTDRPLLFGDDRNFSFRLEEINLSFWRPGEVRQRTSVVSAHDASGAFLGRRRILVNDPLNIGGMSVYQGSRHGFIAGLDVMDEAGTRIQMPIAFRITEDGKGRLLQSAPLPGAGLSLELELFTDKLAGIEGLETLGRHAGTTLLMVNTLDPMGRRQFRGPLFGGSRISFEGLTIEFVSLKPYTSFVLVRDYGIPVVFAGFALLLLGLVVTYFWVPESLWCVVTREGDAERVVLGGVTEKYHESFRERFGELVEDLRKEAMG